MSYHNMFYLFFLKQAGDWENKEKKCGALKDNEN